jgi:hypothetical protein
LEAQRKVVADAQTAESVARAEFETQGKSLRAAKDTLDQLANSDDRMARLIADKETTEGLIETYSRELAFRQQEARRLPEIAQPTEDSVIAKPGDDVRPMYYLIALGSIVLLAAGSVGWTLWSARHLEHTPFAAEPQRAAEPPAPKPVDSSAGEDAPTAIA